MLHTPAARRVEMTSTAPVAPKPLSHPVAKGWLVHCFTASGAVCGMLGIIAVSDGQPKEAMLWLVVAMVLDGLDGPVARHWCVRENVPRIDGYALDLVVDYVTCIVVPVLFLHRFDMLPSGASLLLGAFVLFVSALWMSRTDQMTDDHWFNGFPCEWNMIVPTLYLLDVGPWMVAVTCVALSISQFTNWKFVHPMQVRRFRPVTIVVTVAWMVAVLLMTAERPDQPLLGMILLVACPLYILGIGVWRTLNSSESAPIPTADLTAA
jgi:phosphatidylcholine synthase